MSDTASAQLKRVLALIPRLADGNEHTLAEVAAAAGTEPADLLRDLDSICGRFDAPGGFVEGVSILVEQDTVCVTAREFHRPMRLTMSELCALELGLTILRRERTPMEQAPIDRAVKRLRQAITVVPSNDRHEGTRWADLSESGSAEHLSVLRGALDEARKVSLRYRSGGETESTSRVVSPQSLVFAEQMWYLVATGEDAALRFFRLDRIEAAEALEETFERDPAVIDRVQNTGRAFVCDTARSMTVRYGPRIARWVAEREGTELAADGSLTLGHPVADESWAVRHVLQYGPDAELLSPPDLRAVVASRLASMAGPPRD